MQPLSAIALPFDPVAGPAIRAVAVPAVVVRLGVSLVLLLGVVLVGLFGPMTGSG